MSACFFFTTLFASAFALSSFGCHHNRADKPTTKNWSSVDSDHSAQVTVRGNYDHIQSTITTAHNLDLRVVGKVPDKDGRNPDFHVYYTPPAKLDAPVPVTISYSIPTVEFNAGWGIFTGGYPAARTRRVRAVGVGTSFVLQVRANDDLFINLSSSDHDVDVTALLGNAESSRFRAGQYALIDNTGRVRPAPLSAAPADIQQIATDAESAILGR